MSQHRHKADKTIDRPYTGPVSTNENRAAHGGICVVATCACGAQRRTNRNGNHVEAGRWVTP